MCKRREGGKDGGTGMVDEEGERKEREVRLKNQFEKGGRVEDGQEQRG